MKPNYTAEEVEALIEGYLELSENCRHKAYIQVRLLDIEATLRRLRPAERNAIFLCGIMEITVRTAADILGVDHVKMWRRYRKGLDILLAKLNGV